MNQLEGQILPLSLQMYGCRVIQKVLLVSMVIHKFFFSQTVLTHACRGGNFDPLLTY